MEEEFLRKYYFVGKTTSVWKAIQEFTQGMRENLETSLERFFTKPGSDLETSLGSVWRDKTARSSIAHALEPKQSPNLPIWWKYLELRGIMVNKGRIHRELRKFMMISSNLIQSNYELMIEIGENGTLWKRTSRRFHKIKNHRIWLWFRGEIEDRSEVIFLKLKIVKLTKIKQN